MPQVLTPSSPTTAGERWNSVLKWLRFVGLEVPEKAFVADSRKRVTWDTMATCWNCFCKFDVGSNEVHEELDGAASLTRYVMASAECFENSPSGECWCHAIPDSFTPGMGSVAWAYDLENLPESEPRVVRPSTSRDEDSLYCNSDCIMCGGEAPDMLITAKLMSSSHPVCMWICRWCIEVDPFPGKPKNWEDDDDEPVVEPGEYAAARQAVESMLALGWRPHLKTE